MEHATYRADLALIESDIVADVRIDLAADGSIAAVTPGGDGGERIAGCVVPGLPNLHSHAFQRAMAGLAERAGAEGDNFWRWREVMYRFLAQLSPEDVEAIAAQLYAECLEHGYTSVAEFHYLHNAPDGAAYADPAELSRRIIAAADATGIGLTLLPVLYRHANFGGAPATDGQRRFTTEVDAFARLCTGLKGAVTLGVAPHSLRAVTPEELRRVIALAHALGPTTPIHMHAAEQTKEVDDCVAWSGERPVQWLLANAGVDARWCLIHCTHMTPGECGDLAASGAVAGLCQTTEANLGDGIFPLRAYLQAGGRFGVGTDSNVSTSPVEELRWLEYIRRLETRARNVTESRLGASVAAGLLARARDGGAQALGRRCGSIAPGHVADLVVLDCEHPALIGREGLGILDAWVFSGNATPVRDVMVAGKWVVRDGHHINAARIRAAFARSTRRLAGAL
jgi:formimidoylglutamate deiminase